MKNPFLYSCVMPVLLLVAFIVLKLCKVIAWSWWWVLAPVWTTVALVSLFAVTSFIYLWLKTRKG